MNQGIRSAPAVRMAVSGTIVERREFDEVLSIIASRLQSTSQGCLSVGSVNLDHLFHFRKIAAAPRGRLEWLLLADEMPIAWRGKLLTGEPWPRITGADLLPSLLELAERSGQRVGFFGGSAGTHRLLAESLATRHPALAISGMWAPTAEDIESSSEHLAAAIRNARNDILIVSLGKPRQERWVDQYGCATGPGFSCRAAVPLISWPAPPTEPPVGCRKPAWNGYTGWPASHAGWPAVICCRAPSPCSARRARS
ncbi:hypothetical protein MSHO_02980 [Mycobacterium shottsii]|uniref:Glycosyltransferase n=1 Tax=Mycobacterium shottsii TaxID=133549 RepID=A0A7I7L6U2_9MYCO|nr:hypothetical protein MSHO_02980 [Mycobacterium shottsii]